MNYQKLKKVSIENGDGVRVSLFVSGCRRHCPKCHNPEAWDFNSGEKFTRRVMMMTLYECEKDGISGLSILGGEPLEKENVRDVALLIQAFRGRFGKSKTIWLYTGFTYEYLLELIGTSTKEHAYWAKVILENIDVLVDGEYVDEKRVPPGSQFYGSSNQRIIHLENGNIVTP